MANIAYRILKFEYMIKKPIVPNHAFFTNIFLSRMNSLDNLPFVYLQFHNRSCLNILTGNICFWMKTKNQWKWLLIVQYFKSLVLVQIALYLSNSFSSSLRKDISLLFFSFSPSLTLNISTYLLIFGIIKPYNFI